jgi:type IV pilus assembly protein PilC
MPQFKHIFLTINTELPILTRIVLGISEYLIKNLAWISLSIVVFIVMFLVLLRNSKFRLYFDSFKLKIPIFGELLKKSLLARFARTFSVLFSSGVSLSATLALSSDVTDNVYFSSVIDRVKYRVLSGDYLSDQMQKYNIFTKMFIKMVKIGEKTGKLKDMLKNNADYYDQEVERAIDNFTSLVEPVLIIFIGIVVLIVVVALYLPIFRLALIMAS